MVFLTICPALCEGPGPRNFAWARWADETGNSDIDFAGVEAYAQFARPRTK